jgi:hypothetical protein
VNNKRFSWGPRALRQNGKWRATAGQGNVLGFGHGSTWIEAVRQALRNLYRRGGSL